MCETRGGGVACLLRLVVIVLLLALGQAESKWWWDKPNQVEMVDVTTNQEEQGSTTMLESTGESGGNSTGDSVPGSAMPESARDSVGESAGDPVGVPPGNPVGESSPKEAPVPITPSKNATATSASAPKKPVISGPARFNILQRVRPSDVHMSPYPHLVFKDALPWDLYNQLAAAYPSDDVIVSIAQGDDQSLPAAPQNKRFDIKGANALANAQKIDPIWVDFVKYHTSPAFYKEVMRVFAAALRKERPDFTKGKNSAQLLGLKTKLRHTETADTDVAIDCSIGINTPVKQRSTVRGPHHDDVMELWAGLLYMRNDKDTSKGGDLEVLRCRPGKCKEIPGEVKKKKNIPSNQQYYHGQLTKTAIAKYQKNTLVWFINSERSIHSVTNRDKTPYSRRLVNFIGQKVSLDANGKVIEKKGNLLKVVQNNMKKVQAKGPK